VRRKERGHGPMAATCGGRRGWGPAVDTRVECGRQRPKADGCACRWLLQGKKIKAGWRTHANMRAPATVPGLNPIKLGQNHSNEIEFKF
jgi:hypothetical protein